MGKVFLKFEEKDPNPKKELKENDPNPKKEPEKN
jgi:hypothetical protein